MSDVIFSEFIVRERERLNRERNDILSQQQQLQRNLDSIDSEFAAIQAYEAAKSGKVVRTGAGTSDGRQVRGRRGSKRDELIKVIQQGRGLSRGEILQKMGLKGDKRGEMSVSNALTNLTKANLVRREGGKYYAS